MLTPMSMPKHNSRKFAVPQMFSTFVLRTVWGMGMGMGTDTVCLSTKIYVLFCPVSGQDLMFKGVRFKIRGTPTQPLEDSGREHFCRDVGRISQLDEGINCRRPWRGGLQNRPLPALRQQKEREQRIRRACGNGAGRCPAQGGYGCLWRKTTLHEPFPCDRAAETALHPCDRAAETALHPLL